MKDKQFAEYRCYCGKLLFKAELRKGNVEAKCRGCRRITVFKGVESDGQERVRNMGE